MRIPPQIIEALIPAAGPCYPDWNSVRLAIENLYHENEHAEIWNHVARFWVCGIQQQYGKGYEIYETDNFLLLSKDSKRSIKHACKAYESALKQIFKVLPGIAANNKTGKYVGLMFRSPEEYYQYITPFHQDGENPSSGGMFISSGYSHFAFPVIDYVSSKTVFVHELTHACLSHLSIPLWVNEAIAMRMEQVVCNTITMSMDRLVLQECYEYWNESTIQGFWSGESWFLPGNSNPFSYNLAQTLWLRIEHDLEATQDEILEFLATADPADGGEAAFQQIFEHSLGDLAASLLGEAAWEPIPSDWPTVVLGEDSYQDDEDTSSEQTFQVDLELEDFELQNHISAKDAQRVLPALEHHCIRFYILDEDSPNGSLQTLEDFPPETIASKIRLAVHQEDLARYFPIMHKLLGHPVPAAHKKSLWKNRVRGLNYTPHEDS